MSKRGVAHDNYFDNLCKGIELVMDAASSQTMSSVGHRESVLFIGTQCSNLYTSVDTPARGRVVVRL
jgi:hypothetical protein